MVAFPLFQHTLLSDVLRSPVLPFGLINDRPSEGPFVSTGARSSKFSVCNWNVSSAICCSSSRCLAYHFKLTQLVSHSLPITLLPPFG